MRHIALAAPLWGAGCAPPVAPQRATPLAPPGGRVNGNPDAARLVTSDLPNFWHAVDAAAGRDSAGRVRAFEEMYLRPGSPGLRAWVRVRLTDRGGTVIPALERRGWDVARRTRVLALPDTAAERRAYEAERNALDQHSAAEQLAAFTARAPRYFAEVRARTLALDTSAAITGAIRARFRRLEALYPAAVFPDVYFLFGRGNSGGTPAGGAGLLIGMELNARGDATPLDELPPGLRPVVGRPADLPALVAHEAVHAQQPDLGKAPTLLARALNEGAADFVADLTAAAGAAPAARAYAAYGAAHERELWDEFRAVMGGTDARGWLYGGAPAGRPQDLGYYVGARICEAYYRRAADKRAALRAILASAAAPEAFLRASGYAGGGAGAKDAPIR